MRQLLCTFEWLPFRLLSPCGISTFTFKPTYFLILWTVALCVKFLQNDTIWVSWKIAHFEQIHDFHSCLSSKNTILNCGYITKSWFRITCLISIKNLAFFSSFFSSHGFTHLLQNSKKPPLLNKIIENNIIFSIKTPKSPPPCLIIEMI